jgi:hypothetical protein
VADLRYGDSVTVLSESAGWVQARTEAGQEGYLPIGALTPKKIVLERTDAQVKIRADETDVVLAGKGFSEGLEAALASADASFNFAAVDQAEGQQVDDTRVLSFIRTGKLAEELE